jgi:nicotinamide riboside kinase
VLIGQLPMVKNRALKRDARVIKASTGITYPRARDLLVDPVDQDTLVPSLFLGYGADGGNIIHRPGKGTLLVIGGYSGSGKSVLMSRLAAEASTVASVYVIDVAKGGSDYRDISGGLSALETTAAGALARIRSLTAPRHTASILFVDYIDYVASPEGIPGFREAIQALSDSGMPVIVGGQLPHRALPASMMERADRILIGKTAYSHRQAMLRNPDAPVLGDRYKAVYETAAGSVEVILPPGGKIPEPDYRFEFGTNSTGHPVAFVPAQDRSLYISGSAGSGKTTFLNALAADAVTSMDVYFSNAAFPSEEKSGRRKRYGG